MLTRLSFWFKDFHTIDLVVGEASIWQVVLWEENRLDSCLGFEHREAVFAFADGPSDCEGANGAISAEGLHDGGRAPCHFLTVP